MFDLFKIIFGIIASIAILVFVFRYAGTYTGLQEDTQRVLILEGFKKTAENVYLSGSPESFSGFTKLDFGFSFSGLEDPPTLNSKSGSTPIFIPILFSPNEKEELLLSRTSLDYGWWRFETVIATSRTVVVFSPLDNTEQSLDVIRSIAQALSPASGHRANISFALCNGGEISGFWDSFELSGQLQDMDTFEPCTANMPDTFRLVTVSYSCINGFAGSGVCIRPDNLAFIAGSGLEFPYKDPLDLAFLIIGNDRKDVFGVAEGEKLYKYKNKAYMQSLSLGSRIYGNSLSLISPELQAAMEGIAGILEGQPSACVQAYNSLFSSLSRAASGLETSDMESANTFLLDAKSGYESIKSSQACIRLPVDLEAKLSCSIYGFTELRLLVDEIGSLSVQDILDASVSGQLSQKLEESRMMHEAYRAMGCD